MTWLRGSDPEFFEQVCLASRPGNDRALKATHDYGSMTVTPETPH
jgi:hypothetical protein